MIIKATDKNAQDAVGTAVTVEGNYGHVVSVCDIEVGDDVVTLFRWNPWERNLLGVIGFLSEVEVPEKIDKICPFCGKKE